MNSQSSKQIIKDLCRRLEITETQARDIIQSEFSLLKTKIEEYNLDDKTFNIVRLPKFGVFFVKPGKTRFEWEKMRVLLDKNGFIIAKEEDGFLYYLRDNINILIEKKATPEVRIGDNTIMKTIFDDNLITVKQLEKILKQHKII